MVVAGETVGDDVECSGEVLRVQGRVGGDEDVGELFRNVGVKGVIGGYEV